MDARLPLRISRAAQAASLAASTLSELSCDLLRVLQLAARLAAGAGAQGRRAGPAPPTRW